MNERYRKSTEISETELDQTEIKQSKILQPQIMIIDGNQWPHLKINESRETVIKK